MFQPLALYIGLRYTRARRRNQFISFISSSSMVGVAIGVMALITILSVMNGFEQELRQRILGMTAHATVEPKEGAVTDWRALTATLARQPHVTGTAPYVHAEAMATSNGYVTGIIVQGVSPAAEPKVSFIGEKMIDGRLDKLVPGGFGIILGRSVARSLHVNVGDKVTVISPQPISTAAGIIPRSKRFTVAGVFEVGYSEYDTAFALMHIDDAARLFRISDGVSGIRLKFDDVFAAPAFAASLGRALDGQYQVTDWTRQHASFFQALKTEKAMMFAILALIVAVAAFNIVSTLVMVVTDKQADIAILRTLGLAPRAVMGIFIVQGVIIGFIGTLFGGAAGVWLATHVQVLVKWLEANLHFRILPPDVYYISELPSDLHWSDVTLVSVVAFVLCLLATVYPALRAAGTQPAEALRYE